MRTFKRILILLLIIFIAAQFYRSPKNLSANDTQHISTAYPVPDSVQTILVKACYDCHSNKTRYPWYAEVQPVSAWLYSHVKDGKAELNFSEFASYRLAKQYHKLEECIDKVKGGHMPIGSYTITHTDAKLGPEEKNKLMNWFTSVMDSMKTKYPIDSLIRKRK